MSVSSKNQVCNMALARLGQKSTVENIDSPKTSVEKIFAREWNNARELALAIVRPNFAIVRRYITIMSTSPEFGYGYQYQYPSDCVAFLGIGETKDKKIAHVVESNESGVRVIATDEYTGEPLPCRIVVDRPDVSLWDAPFANDVAWFLAYLTNMAITQDVNKQSYFESIIKEKHSACASLQALDNPPVRKNTCHFREARTSGFPQKYNKL